MPYQLYVDESGTAEDEVFLIAGLAVRDENFGACRERWCSVLQRAGRSPLDEVHWHTLAGRGSDDRRGSARLLDALFGALRELPIICFAVSIKTDAARKARPDLFGTSPFGADAEVMYGEALAWLLERYQLVLGRSEAYGSILLDSRVRRGHLSKDEALLDRIKQWFREGRMGGTPDERLELENLLESVQFEDSRDRIGLQMVDLVAGCTRRRWSSDDADAKRWFAVIEPRFARHPKLNDVDGTGLVRWPRSHAQRGKPQNDLTAFER